MGIPKICLTKNPPANKPRDSHEIRILISAYQASIFCVESPYLLPINSGMVILLQPNTWCKNQGQKQHQKNKSIPIKIDGHNTRVIADTGKGHQHGGPTLVPHILKPILAPTQRFIG